MGMQLVSFYDLRKALGPSAGLGFGGFGRTRRMLRGLVGGDGLIGRSYFMDGSSNSLWLANVRRPRADVGVLHPDENAEVVGMVRDLSPFVKVMEEGVEPFDYELHDRRRTYEMFVILQIMHDAGDHDLRSVLGRLESKAVRLLGGSWHDVVGGAFDSISAEAGMGRTDKALDMAGELDRKLDKLSSSKAMDDFRSSMAMLDDIIRERDNTGL